MPPCGQEAAARAGPDRLPPAAEAASGSLRGHCTLLGPAVLLCPPGTSNSLAPTSQPQRHSGHGSLPTGCPVCPLPPPTPKSSPAPCAWTGQIPLTRAWGHPNSSSLSRFARKRRLIVIALLSVKRNELKSPLGSSDTWTGLGGSTYKLSLPSLSSSQQLPPPVSCWSMT